MLGINMQHLSLDFEIQVRQKQPSIVLFSEYWSWYFHLQYGEDWLRCFCKKKTIKSLNEIQVFLLLFVGMYIVLDCFTPFAMTVWILQLLSLAPLTSSPSRERKFSLRLYNDGVDFKLLSGWKCVSYSELLLSLNFILRELYVFTAFYLSSTNSSTNWRKKTESKSSLFGSSFRKITWTYC